MRAIASGTCLALIGAVAAGCGAPAVSPRPSDPAIPARWTDAPDTASAPDWWDSFPGEAPRALVAEALASNRDLAAAAARLDAAAAEARIAGADLFPQLSAGGSAARSQQVFVGLPIPGQSGPLTSRSNAYGVSLDLAWELDLWGRLRQHRSAGAAEWQASAADYEGARLSLAGQTLKAWFAAVEASRQLALAQETVATHDRTVDGIRDRYRAGGDSARIRGRRVGPRDHGIMGMNLTMLSAAGLVALSGVVVNDSLVMVDFVNRCRREGMSAIDAVRSAGPARFRAIMLTSLSTFAGVAPLLLERSLQAQFLKPLAVSLGFGVLFSTILILVIVPAAYLVLIDAETWVARRFGRAAPELQPAGADHG